MTFVVENWFYIAVVAVFVAVHLVGIRTGHQPDPERRGPAQTTEGRPEPTPDIRLWV